MNKRSKKLELTREHVRALTTTKLQEVAGGASIGFICQPYPSRDACSVGLSCIPSGDRCY